MPAALSRRGLVGPRCAAGQPLLLSLRPLVIWKEAITGIRAEEAGKASGDCTGDGGLGGAWRGGARRLQELAW